MSSKLRKVNVLFVGHFTAKSSWGQAANDYVKCLSKDPNINLKCANFAIGDEDHNCEFQDTEAYKHRNTELDTNDVLVQMCFPSFFYRDGRFSQNIGIFFSECYHGAHYNGTRRVNLMDKLIVASDTERSYWQSHHSKVYNVGLPIDLSKYQKKYEDYSHLTKINKQTYTFYNISEDSERKNLEDIVRAYYLAFTNKDNVRLILKVDKKSNIRDRIQNIKKEVRSIHQNNWPDVGIINQHMTNDEIYSLHQSSDCYVSAAHGEAWCYPMADAVIFRNMVISSLNLEYLRSQHTVLESYIDSCKVKSPPTPYHYTGYDTWHYIKVEELAQEMRSAYIKRPFSSLSSSDLSLFETSYSYEGIGRKMYDVFTNFEHCLENLGSLDV